MVKSLEGSERQKKEGKKERKKGRKASGHHGRKGDTDSRTCGTSPRTYDIAFPFSSIGLQI